MITRSKNKKNPTLVTLSLVIGTLGYGYYWTIMNNALQTMEILLSGLIVSGQMIGSILGSIFIFFTVQTISRRLATTLIDICYIVGAGLSIIANYEVFFIARLITGFAIGADSILTPLFLQELLPIEFYGFLSGSRMVFLSIGQIGCNIFGLFFVDVKGYTKDQINPYFWRTYFLVGSIFNIVRMIIMFFFMKYDSPIYYLKTEQFEKLKEFFYYMYKPVYIDEVQEELEKAVMIRQQNKDKFKQILHKNYRNQLKLGIVMNVAQPLSGIETVLQYSTTLFRSVTSVQWAEIFTLGFTFVKLFFYVTVQFVSQKYGKNQSFHQFQILKGRRRPLLFGTFLITLTCLLCGISQYIIEDMDHEDTIYKVASYSVISVIYVYIIGYVYSFGGIKSQYSPEFLTEGALSLTLFISWTGSFIMTFIFPIIKLFSINKLFSRNKYGVAVQFFAYFFFLLLAFIYFYKEARETKGLTEQQVFAVFNNKNQDSSMVSDALMNN